MNRWEPYLRNGFRVLIATSDYAVTMFVALGLFAAIAIEFPAAMRDLLTFVKQIDDFIKDQHPSDPLMLWADILLQPPLVILILFSIATRLFFEVAYTAFNKGQFPPDMAAPEAPEPVQAPSPFAQWK